MRVLDIVKRSEGRISLPYFGSFFFLAEFAANHFENLIIERQEKGILV